MFGLYYVAHVYLSHEWDNQIMSLKPNSYFSPWLNLSSRLHLRPNSLTCATFFNINFHTIDSTLSSALLLGLQSGSPNYNLQQGCFKRLGLQPVAQLHFIHNPSKGDSHFPLKRASCIRVQIHTAGFHSQPSRGPSCVPPIV